MSDDPIASHVEANPERSGRFTLYPDRLEVVIKRQLRSVLTESIPLSTLSSSVAWLRVRTSAFGAGLWALTVATLGLVLIQTFHQLEPARALIYAVAVLGVFLSLVGLRRILFLVVRARDGHDRLVVGVGKKGKHGLEAFAQTLQAAISSAEQHDAARG